MQVSRGPPVCAAWLSLGAGSLTPSLSMFVGHFLSSTGHVLG